MFDLFVLVIGFGLGYGFSFLTYRDSINACRKLQSELTALISKFHYKP
jgi:hypothetical protein